MVWFDYFFLNRFTGAGIFGLTASVTHPVNNFSATLTQHENTAPTHPLLLLVVVLFIV